MKFCSLLLSFNIFLLNGCGYRWQPDHLDGTRPTVMVPFIQGDLDGKLTTEVISALSTSGIADVVSRGGDYRLEVILKNSEEANIGFRQDTQKIKGKERSRLVPSEGRKTISFEAILYLGDQIAFGPYQIQADAEYDYVDGDDIQDLTFTNPGGETLNVLPFSLGQLESVEAAQEAARVPLYRKMAQKIVDAISSNW